jgi:hypothetical protein
MKKTLVLSLFFSCIFLLAAQSSGPTKDEGVNTYFGDNLVPDPAFATCANVTPGTNWTCTPGVGLVAAAAPSNSSTTIHPVSTGNGLYVITYVVTARTSGTVIVDPNGHGTSIACASNTTCVGSLLESTGAHSTTYIRAVGGTFTGTISFVSVQQVL